MTSARPLLFLLCLGMLTAWQRSGESPAAARRIQAEAEKLEAAGKSGSAAARYWQAAGEYAEARQDPADWAFCLRSYAYLTGWELRRPNEAAANLEAALEKAWEGVPGLELGELYVSVGYYTKEAGRYFMALPAYEKARAAHEKAYKEHGTPLYEKGDDVAEFLYKQPANIYTRLGENERARRLLRAGLKWVESPYSRQAVSMYNDLALALFDGGQPKEGLSFFNTGLQRVKPSDMPVEEKNALQSMLLAGKARCLLALKDTAAAIGAARQSVSLAGGDSTSLANGSATLGEILVAGRRAGEALPHLRKAGAILERLLPVEDRRELSKVELAAAKAHGQLGQHDQALELCQQALIRVLPGFRDRSPQANPDPALFYPENTILEGLTLKGELYAGLAEKGEAGQQAALQSARGALAAAVAMEERLRSVYLYPSAKRYLAETSFDRHQRLIGVLYRLYERSGDPSLAEEAFVYAEKSKAAVFNERLLDNLALNSADNSLSRQEQTLASRVSLLRQQLAMLQLQGTAPDDPAYATAEEALAGAEEAYLPLRKQLADENPAYLQARRQPDAIALADVRERLLGRQSALAAYFLNEQSGELYIWVAGPEDLRFEKRKLDLDGLGSLLALLRDGSTLGNDPLNPGRYRRLTRLSADLYQQLLGGLLPSDRPRELIVLADGPLHFLPFDVLLTKAVPDAPVRYASLPYLFSETTVRYGLSAGSLLSLRDVARERHSYRGDYLGIAPDYTGSARFSPVGEGPGLIASAGALFRRPALFSGRQALADTLLHQASSYRIVHFHGHAVAVDDQPGLSFLAFSSTEAPPIAMAAAPPDSTLSMLGDSLQLPPDELPRLLPLARLLESRARSELVVLSACETGLGRFSRGEGINSIAGAFHAAGVPAVVMSLWSVDKTSTSRLMESYFKQLAAGAGKAEALRQARRAFLADPKNDVYADPYYWTGFVLMGDNEPVITKSIKFSLTLILLAIIGIGILANFLRKRSSGAFLS